MRSIMQVVRCVKEFFEKSSAVVRRTFPMTPPPMATSV
jgi:hypothetical protein